MTRANLPRLLILTVLFTLLLWAVRLIQLHIVCQQDPSHPVCDLPDH